MLILKSPDNSKSFISSLISLIIETTSLTLFPTGPPVAKEGFVPTKEIFTTGESFALAFRQGDVLAAPEGDEPKKLEASSGKEHF